MYNYSPIKKIYIKNFRNLGEVELDFTESPIITLVGENEAGKTSVIKAFATCALHANPRDQKDYIRDGTKMFGVAIELEDGNRVVRIKEASGINSYQILDSNGTVKFNTNKLAEGLPIEVQNLMGLIAEPETGEFLHIRTYEDKLLFVVTPNSTNYKVMYNALKVEQLTKAIKNGSNEVNGLKSLINNNEVSMQTLQGQMRAINIIDTEPLLNVRDRLEEQLAFLDKLERARNLVNTVKKCETQLGALNLLDKFDLQPINEVIASKLNSVNRLLTNKNKSDNLLSIYKDIDSLEIIDTGNVHKLINIINKITELNNKLISAGTLTQISEISEISEIVVIQLNKLMNLTSKLESQKKHLDTIDTDGCDYVSQIDIDSLDKLNRIATAISKISVAHNELNQINDYIVQVQEYLKQCGVAVETCPKCGEAVVIDIDKLN